MATLSPRRRPSVTEVGKMRVVDLRDALKSALTELREHDEVEAAVSQDTEDVDDGSSVKIGSTLKHILTELRALRAERGEVKQLRQECNALREVVTQQQVFMEQLDARDRQCNVLITGVPEEQDGDLESAVSDGDKCDVILQKMGVRDVQPVEISRVGRPQEGRKRPILLKVASKGVREKVLENTKALKEAGPLYKSIFVRKDTHPATRNEWKRLKDAESSEKEKPENQGCTIELDFRSRELRRDGVVIDRYTPSYFRRVGPTN